MKHLILAMCLARRCRAACRPHRTVEGTWRADNDNYWTRSQRALDLTRAPARRRQQRHRRARTRSARRWRTARTDGPVHFTLRRDAGTFDFTGRLADGRGRGDFTLHAQRRFRVGHGAARLPRPRRTTTSGGSRLHDITRVRFAPGGQEQQGLGRPDIDELREDADPRRHARVHQGDAGSGLQGSADRQAGAAAHPRRHAGVRQGVQRSRLQEPRPRRPGQRCGSTA